MTLYDKLKPHIKDKLDAQAEKYVSINYIYDNYIISQNYNAWCIFLGLYRLHFKWPNITSFAFGKTKTYSI